MDAFEKSRREVFYRTREKTKSKSRGAPWQHLRMPEKGKVPLWGSHRTLRIHTNRNSGQMCAVNHLLQKICSNFSAAYCNSF